MNEDQVVPLHLWHYAEQQDRMRNAASQLRMYLLEVLDAAGIDVHTVESRAKSLHSYRNKAEKFESNGRAKYQDPEREITDCVAARIIVFTKSARATAVELLERATSVVERSNPGQLKNNGYDSDHLIVTAINDESMQRRAADLHWYLDSRPGLEIQVRSVAGHAWAEYEHDVRYKTSGYAALPKPQRDRIDQLFVEAGGLRKYLDETFNHIDKVLRPDSAPTRPAVTEPLEEADLEQTAVPPAESVDLSTLVISELISLRYPGVEQGDEHDLGIVLAQLRGAGIRTVSDLDAALVNVDSDQVAALMSYQISPSALRRFDDDLLAGLGEAYVDALPEGEEDRARFLSGRLRRVRGKLLIYAIEGAPRLEGAFFAAARTFREIVRIVAQTKGPEAAVIPGAVSLEDNLDPSARARTLSTSKGRLWVNTNMTRATAEECIIRLLAKLPGEHISVLRAGELLGATPDV